MANFSSSCSFILFTHIVFFNSLKSFIGFGVGLGANVMLRYAILNQRRLDALILVNCVHSPAGWIEWGYQKMNLSYLRKTGMTSFTVDYLMWHHFGRRIDLCSADIVRQYRLDQIPFWKFFHLLEFQRESALSSPRRSKKHPDVLQGGYICESFDSVGFTIVRRKISG